MKVFVTQLTEKMFRQTYYISILIFSVFTVKVYGNAYGGIYDEHAIEKWADMERRIKDMVKYFFKQSLPTLEEATRRMNLSTNCMNEGIFLMGALRRLEPWAFQIVASSAKNVHRLPASYAAYDDCINTIVRSNKSEFSAPVFRGKYCTIDFKPPIPPLDMLKSNASVIEAVKNFSAGDSIIRHYAKNFGIFYLHWVKVGICVPSGCTIDDIEKVGKLLGDPFGVDAHAGTCEIKQEKTFSLSAKISILCFIFTACLVFAGTVLDSYSYYRKIIYSNMLCRILMSFSMRINFERLVSPGNASYRNLTCLHGMKFFSILWVILVHTYLMTGLFSMDGVIKFKELSKQFFFQPICNASLSTDSFFFIGGFLVCYLSLKYVKLDGHSFSAVLYLCLRLWRTLPVYIYVILFVFIFNEVGSGPVWDLSTMVFSQQCYNSWWKNLLFINNFFEGPFLCIPHTWYLACDFQLYIAALVTILLLLRKPVLGLATIIFAIVGSIVYSGLMTAFNYYPPASQLYEMDMDRLASYLPYFYFNPIVHASPYFFGMLTGYILIKKPDLRIPKEIQVVGWILAFTCNFGILFGGVQWNQEGVQASVVDRMMYAGLSRSAWAAGLSWLTICCATGHGGIVNSFLSMRIYIPLSRLVYIVYLIHPLIQIYYAGNSHTDIELNHMESIWNYLGHICVSFMVAFLGMMFIEAPYASLGKVILPSNKKPPKKEAVNGNNIFYLKKNINGTLDIMDIRSPEICNNPEKTKL